MPFATRRFFAIPAALLLSFALGACSDRDASSPTPAVATADGQAPTPATHYTAPADTAGFHVEEMQGYSQYGRPAVKVRFSEPVAAQQTFDQLLDIKTAEGQRPNGSWQLEDENTTLVFPYLEADTRYTLTIGAALAAAGDATLGQPFTHEVYSGPQPPMLGFASQGHVLPAGDSAGLPVITVNVAEADVEFLRVRESSLPAFLGDYQRNGQRSSWELESLPTYADSVYASRFALRADANERTLNHVPVRDIAELSEPGAYFAVMHPAGKFDSNYETALFFVSDIGLHVRMHADGAFVHAASLASGKALGGVALSVLDRHGQSVAEIETDGDGNATLALKPKQEHLLIAKLRSDFSMLSFRQPALDLSAFAIGGRKSGGDRDVFLWGGRDLFRPGEEVRVHGLLRDFDGKAVDASPLFAQIKQPDGRVYARSQIDADAMGYFTFNRTLPVDVPTGRWTLEVRLDPEGEPVGEFALRIEDFLPERLKLELTSSADTLKPGDALPLAVEGAYLYGAPAAGNRFLAELSFEHAPDAVEAMKGFHFGDPTAKLPTPTEPALDGKLDDAGHLSVDLALPSELPTTTPVAVFVRGSLFESGGRAISRTLKRVIWPADQMVGVRPLFDLADGASVNAPIGFEIVRSDHAGTLSVGDVEVALMRDRRDYIWTHDPALGWKVEYTSNWEAVGAAQNLTLNASGAARYDASVEWGDYRLDVTDRATGLVTRLPFQAGWGSDDENQGDAARPDKVKLALDKTAYRAGDPVTLTLTPPHAGAGLLLIEAGNRLLETRELDVEAGSTLTLEVKPEWERHDIYLTAIVFRAGSASEKITPNRAIGIVHLPIDRSDRTLALTVDAPDRARPGEELVVTISAPALAGQEAMATLAAVDQGIINITRYPVPNAANHFFSPRGYSVDAYDIYGKVIEHREGYGARLRYGGDLALAALPQARRPTAKVATVDLFAGPVKLDAQGNATVRLTLPDFNGRLRLAALVYSADRYGSAEDGVEVRAPLVAEISSPRVMAPGDRSQVTLDLHNLSGKAQNLVVDVSAERPLAVENGRRTVDLADEQRTVLSLPLTALPGQDVGRLRVRVTGDGIDLDRRFELVVRPGWAPARSSRLDELSSGTPIMLGSDATSAYLPGSGALALSVSRQPPVPFSSAVEGLIGYPYGCIEQTTSRAFPLALLDDATAEKLGIVAVAGEKRREALDNALGRISAMQLPSGHFSFWGGEGQAQTQLTPFVAEFLIEARDAGQAIPQAVLDAALERLNEDLLSGGDQYYAYDNASALRFAVRAHAAYVLARLNRAPLGTLRAMQQHERGDAKSLLSLVHLGLALHLQGDAPRGMETLVQAFGNPPERPNYLGDYGTELRDRALSLALLRQHEVRVPEADGELLALARSLAGGETGNRYLSTQEQLALFRLGRQLRRLGADPIAGTLSVGGESTPIESTPMFTRLFDDAELARGANVSITGEGTLYAIREAVGVPRNPPAAVDSGLSIRRDWFGTDGKPFTGASLKEGDSVVVRLTIEAQQGTDDLLVVDYLPGGLEAENLNLTDARLLERMTVDGMALSERGGVDVRHEEYRDDRYVAALRMYQGQTAQLYYIARAVSPGEFNVPPPQAEDMYRADLRAVGTSRVPRLTVTPP
jgi:uncharacterized protein YfaS (alpha-2-macroglobulin family)